MTEVIGLPERRRRQRLLSRLLLAAGLVLALVAGVGSYVVISQQTAPPPPPVARPTTPVVVAAAALEARTAIGAVDVKVVRIDSALVPDRALGDPAAVIGQILTVTVAAGEPILSSKFVAPSGAPFTVLPPGTTLGPATADYRALSINVGDANAVGGYVQAGDVIDIIFTITYEQPRSSVAGTLPVAVGSTQGGALERAARVVFERIPVLARSGTVYTIRTDAASAERLAVLLNSDTQILFLLRAPRDDRAGKAPGATLTNETLPFLRIPGVQR